MLYGPSPVTILNGDKIRGFASGMFATGIYEFELIIAESIHTIVKDTINITVADPGCTQMNKEVMLKDIPWDYSWIMEIDIPDYASYLPPNSHLTNIYIKRDNSNDWEKVVPEDYRSPDLYKYHEWSFGNNYLVIYPGQNLEHDTPDVKLEYCN